MKLIKWIKLMCIKLICRHLFTDFTLSMFKGKNLYKTNPKIKKRESRKWPKMRL